MSRRKQANPKAVPVLDEDPSGCTLQDKCLTAVSPADSLSPNHQDESLDYEDEEEGPLVIDTSIKDSQCDSSINNSDHFDSPVGNHHDNDTNNHISYHKLSHKSDIITNTVTSEPLLIVNSNASPDNIHHGDDNSDDQTNLATNNNSDSGCTSTGTAESSPTNSIFAESECDSAKACPETNHDTVSKCVVSSGGGRTTPEYNSVSSHLATHQHHHPHHIENLVNAGANSTALVAYYNAGSVFGVPATVSRSPPPPYIFSTASHECRHTGSSGSASPLIAPSTPSSLHSVDSRPSTPNKAGSGKKNCKDKIVPIRAGDSDQYTCPVCSILLTDLHSLTVHIRSHNAGAAAIQANTCTICGKVLSSQSSLDRHMLVHSGERPFKCKICHMSFTTNGNMHRHSRIHKKDDASDLTTSTVSSQLAITDSSPTTAAASAGVHITAEGPKISTGKSRNRGRGHARVNLFSRDSSTPSMALFAKHRQHLENNFSDQELKEKFNVSFNTLDRTFATEVSGLAYNTENSSSMNGFRYEKVDGNADVKGISDFTMKRSLLPTTLDTYHSLLTTLPKKGRGRKRKTIMEPKRHVPSPPPVIHHCPLCRETFTNDVLLQTHLDSHPEITLRCSTCNLVFRTNRGLAMHKLVAHSKIGEDDLKDMAIKEDVVVNTASGDDEQGENHPDDEQSRGFNDLDFMDFTVEKFPLVAQSWCEKHIRRRSRSPNQDFLCKECDKAFPCASALQLHKFCHIPESATTCHLCECSFEENKQLRIHMIKHMSDLALVECREEIQNTGSDNSVHTQLEKRDFLAMFELHNMDDVADRGQAISAQLTASLNMVKTERDKFAKYHHQQRIYDEHKEEVSSPADRIIAPHCDGTFEKDGDKDSGRGSDPPTSPLEINNNQENIKSRAISDDGNNDLDDMDDVNGDVFNEDEDVRMTHGVSDEEMEEDEDEEIIDSMSERAASVMERYMSRVQPQRPSSLSMLPNTAQHNLSAVSPQLPSHLTGLNPLLRNGLAKAMSASNAGVGSTGSSSSVHSAFLPALNVININMMQQAMSLGGVPHPPAAHQQTPDHTEVMLPPRSTSTPVSSDDSISSGLAEMLQVARKHGAKVGADGKPIFCCQYCEMTFSNFRFLKGHLRTHLGLSPYKCSLCPYSSADKSTLIRHLRTHNGERPFQCLVCDFAFTTKANCERHVRKKHRKTERDDIENSIGYSKFETDPSLAGTALETFPSPDTVCKYCGEDLKFIRALKRHVLSHHENCNVKQFVCRKCGIGFATKPNCVRHMMKQHSEVPLNAVEQFIQISEPLPQLNGSMDADRYDTYSPESDTMSRYSSPDTTVAKEAHSQSPFGFYEAGLINGNTCRGDPPPAHSNCTTARLPAWLTNPITIKTESLDNMSVPTTTFHQPLDLSYAARSRDILKSFNFQQRVPSPYVSHDAPMDLTLDRSKEMLFSLRHGGVTLRPCHFCAQCFSSEETLQRHIRLRHLPQLSNGQVSPVTGGATTPLASTQLESLLSQNAKTSLLSHTLSTQKYIASSAAAMKSIQRGRLLNVPSRKEYAHKVAKLSDENTLKSAQAGADTGYELSSISKMLDATNCNKFQAFFANRTPLDDASRTPSPHMAHILQQNINQNHHNMNNDNIDSEKTLCLDEMRRCPNGFYETMNAARFASTYEDEDDEDEDEEEDGLYMDVDENEMTSALSRREYTDDINAMLQSHQRCAISPQRDLDTSDDYDTETRYILNSAKEVAEAIQKSDNYSMMSEPGSECDGQQPKRKRNSYADSPHKLACPYCPRSFPWVSSLTRHLLTHTGQKPFKCPRCPVTFSTKSNRERHLIRKHGVNMLDPTSRQTMDRPFKCHLCVFSSFSTRGNLLRHYGERHPEATIPDTITKDDLEMKLENADALYEMDNGLNGEEMKEAMEIFMMEKEEALNNRMEESMLPMIKASEVKTEIYEEDKPSPVLSVFQSAPSSFEEIPNNMNTAINLTATTSTPPPPPPSAHNNLSNVISNTSSNIGVTAPSRLPHMNINPERDNYNVDKIMSCWKCLAEYPSRKLLVRHLKDHNIDYPYKCYLCDASYESRLECLKHKEKNHVTDWSLLCEKNGVDGVDKFTSIMDELVERNYRLVEALNNGESAKSLANGTGSLGSLTNIPEEMRSEMVASDYQQRKVYCSLCPKRFWSLQDLRRHMRSHTGEKPFECDLCQKRFTLKHSMIRHRKKHFDTDAATGSASDDEDASTLLTNVGEQGHMSAVSKHISAVPTSIPTILMENMIQKLTQSTILATRPSITSDIASRISMSPLKATHPTVNSATTSRTSSPVPPSSSKPVVVAKPASSVPAEEEERKDENNDGAPIHEKNGTAETVATGAGDLLQNLLGVEGDTIDQMLDSAANQLVGK